MGKKYIEATFNWLRNIAKNNTYPEELMNYSKSFSVDER